MNPLIFCSLLLLILIFFPSNATAEIQSFATDKSQYFEAESVSFSGKVNFDENTSFLILRVLNPSESDFVFITQLTIKPDGNFNGSFVTGGPKWSSEGPYKILVNYGTHSHEKIIQFKFKPDPADIPASPIKEPIRKETSTEKISKDNNTKLETIEILEQTNLKNRIPGFPSLAKSPEYYFNRHASEQDYRIWFDSQFPNRSIEEVVGYKKTHITNFPDESNSPLYYIQRYQKEPEYRNWFDSQFPHKSIYSILGFNENTHVPEWIKMNAGWWSTGKISDNEFVQGLQYMLENDIIILNNIHPSNNSEIEIPSWIRNVANWWSTDMISEDEFVQSIRYLIEQGIVVVN